MRVPVRVECGRHRDLLEGSRRAIADSFRLIRRLPEVHVEAGIIPPEKPRSAYTFERSAEEGRQTRWFACDADAADYASRLPDPCEIRVWRGDRLIACLPSVGELVARLTGASRTAQT